MENTLENKMIFIAQYWGQKIIFIKEHPKNLYDINDVSRLKTDGCLLLKSIENITDSDAIQFINIGYDGYKNITILRKAYNGIGFEFEYKTSKRRRKGSLTLNYVSTQSPNVHQIDFLKSKGYAVDYMGLSIKKLQEYGWIKLKENAKD